MVDELESAKLIISVFIQPEIEWLLNSLLINSFAAYPRRCMAYRSTFAKTYFSKLGEIRKLAGQTMWYGVSSIAARLINYLLTPYLTYSLTIKTADFGKMALVYAAIPVFNIIFTYGFETAFFRFSSTDERHNRSVYSTAVWSLTATTLLLSALMWHKQQTLTSVLGLDTYPQLVQLGIIIIALDALSAIPFARLRQEGRPVKFALIRISGILINVFLTWFFVSYCTESVRQDPNSWVLGFFNPGLNPIVYVLAANLIQSALTLVLLGRELLQVRPAFNGKLWLRMMIYALPLLVAGLGGMINETLDRLMLNWWLPGSTEEKQSAVGIYNACYKLALLITLFIQAFRMGAEPFFFKQSTGANPGQVYARVMKFFVIVVSLMFLVVALFIPVWKYFIGPRYWSGLSVVPVLLFANIFLGIYYNLSIWYKLSNNTLAGAWITLAGSVVTIVINYLFIPRYGFNACAWSTFLCYGTMMVISFKWGQKRFRIPYAWKKLLAYLVIVAILFFLHKGLIALWPNRYFALFTALVLTAAYCRFILLVEKKELVKLPVLGRLIR
jgi:O-antigen/teichoic acid export membrane protein